MAHLAFAQRAVLSSLRRTAAAKRFSLLWSIPQYILILFKNQKSEIILLP
jgi:hypothetical protein